MCHKIHILEYAFEYPYIDEMVKNSALIEGLKRDDTLERFFDRFRFPDRGNILDFTHRSDANIHLYYYCHH